MASGLSRVGGPLKSTGAKKSISVTKPPGDYINTTPTTPRGERVGGGGNRNQHQSIQEGGINQTPNTSMKGPVAGYIENEIPKTTEEIINDYTKGEQYGKERNRGRFDSDREQSRDPNIRAGQKLEPGNTEDQYRIKEEQNERQRADAEEKESIERIKKVGEEIEMNSKAPLPVVIPRKPVGGLGFYFILLIVLTKDIIDIVWEIIGLFADVTIILGIVMWIISTIMDTIVVLTTNFYFWLEDIPKGSLKTKIQVISTVAEMLPIVGFLPINSIAFIMIRMNENKRRKEEGKQMEEEVKNEREQKISDSMEIYTALDELHQSMPLATKHINEATNETHDTMNRAGYKLKDPNKPISPFAQRSIPKKPTPPSPKPQ